MFRIVLTENEIHQVSVFIDNGKRIQFMFPDDVVRFFQRRFGGRGDHLFDRRHKLPDGGGYIHSAHAVIAARHDTEKFPVALAVIRNGDGRQYLRLF